MNDSTRKALQDALDGWNLTRDPELVALTYKVVQEADLPLTEWTALAVLGYYTEALRLSGRPVPSSLGPLYTQVLTLVSRHGVETAARGIAVLFSERCEWVKGKDLAFLLGSTWDRHVAPYTKEVRPSRGEQSEFGPTDRAKGFKKEAL